MKKENMTWISAHLFYEKDSVDQLLIEGVYPFLEEIREDDKISNYFFIRYREHGNHIRLRVLHKNSASKIAFKEEMAYFFEDYFEKHPSERVTPKAVERGDYYWYPNNSFHFIDYERETDRYGGNLGISIAETHFQASSDVILATLVNNNIDSYENKLSHSLLLNLAFLKGLNFNATKIVRFSRFIYENFLPHAFRKWNAFELEEEAYLNLREKTLNKFQEKYLLQKKDINKKIKLWWEQLDKKNEKSIPYIKNWILSTNTVSENYAKQYGNNNIQIPSGFDSYLKKLLDRDHIDINNSNLWYIYQSLVHMNNNRMGLLTRDEPWLFYLIHQTFKDNFSM